jgi:hypothetical protein
LHLFAAAAAAAARWKATAINHNSIQYSIPDTPAKTMYSSYVLCQMQLAAPRL